MSKGKESQNLRVVAGRIIATVIEDGQSLSKSFPALSADQDPRDRALLQELVYGTCRWYFFLKHHTQQFLRRPLSRKDQTAEWLLALGSYQLIFTRIPAHAAIHETVDACEAFKLGHLKGLINAVLRRVSENTLKIDREAHALSHPEWMRAKLHHNWPDHADAIFAANNAAPPLSLRVNSKQINRSEYLDILSKTGIEAYPCEYASQGITLKQACDVSSLPGFQEGQVSVQDEAAQLCTEVMALEPGMRVLDACAAPGGKTCALLENVDNLSVLALELDTKRGKRISENLERLKLTAELVIESVFNVDTWWDRQAFDRILLDAPCSATGVIRRHPDIKLLRSQEDIKQLAEVQLNMLQTLWPCLKPGGLLVYATCSIFPQENSRIIERFLKLEDSASQENIEADWGIDTQYGRQLFPKQGGHDGFFYACLKKQN